jgi:hypothetical protein
VNRDPHFVRDKDRIITAEPPRLDAPARELRHLGQRVPALLPVRLGQGEALECGPAEHHPVHMRVGPSVVPVCPAEEGQVGHRVTGGLD